MSPKFTLGWMAEMLYSSKNFSENYTATMLQAAYEDFAFLVLITTNLVAEEIVSAEEPFSVPSMLLYSLAPQVEYLLC